MQAKRIVSLSIAAFFLTVVITSVFTARMPQALLGYYLAVSLVTFLWYAKDKSAARKNARRTPESTLHLLSLIGGWPGALVAQQELRHKTRKQPFRLLFWVTVVLNSGAFVCLYTPEGAQYLRSLIGNLK